MFGYDLFMDMRGFFGHDLVCSSLFKKKYNMRANQDNNVTKIICVSCWHILL